MKSLLFIFLTLSFIISNTAWGNLINDNTPKEGDSTNTQALQIECSPELIDLANQWAVDYSKINPGFQLSIKETAEESIPYPEKIFLVTEGYLPTLKSGTAWEMPVARDLIVPITNAQSPLLEKISQTGLTPENFSRLIHGETNWLMPNENAERLRVRLYVAGNPDDIKKIATYTQTDESAFQAQSVQTATELVSLIRQDKFAIGFCKLADIIQPKKNAFTDQIAILPLDKNKNGRLDSFEQIFNSPDKILRGARLGKYPHELVESIYVVTATEPTEKSTIDFLTWLYTDGQKTLEANGFSTLTSRDKSANMNLFAKPVPEIEPNSRAFIPSGWILSVCALIIILSATFLAYRQKQKRGVQSEDIEINPTLNENLVSAPAGLYYDRTHTWAFMEQNGDIKVGVDDFLQHVTGEFTQIKMKSPGETIRKGEKIITVIREGKQLELYSPVSGTIMQQNENLRPNPGLLYSSPYTAGWLYLITPTNWQREIRFLLPIEKYKLWLEDEFIRLKDFLAATANSNQGLYKHLILQDGGELTDNVLSNLEPTVWEDFQTSFINKSR